MNMKNEHVRILTPPNLKGTTRPQILDSVVELKRRTRERNQQKRTGGAREPHKYHLAMFEE